MRWLALVAAASIAAPAPSRGQEGVHGVGPAPPRSPGGVPVGPVPAPPRGGVPSLATPGGTVTGRPASPGPGLHGVAPAPPRHGPWRVPYGYPYYSYYPYYPYAPYFYPYTPYFYDPFWYGPGWGWGLGWGVGFGWGLGWAYDPTAPPPPPGYVPPPPPPYAPSPPVHEPLRISSRLDVTGGPTLKHGGSALGLNLEVAGERFGFHAGIDGLYPGYGGPGFGGGTTYTFATAHLTYAVLATERVRLRLEAGGSLLSWPDSGPDAGLTSFGPDFGVAARVHLVGPLGIEGYLRGTPAPIPILDAQAALALRFGPVALTAGWRDFAVRKSDENAARFAFAGPQFGLGLRF